MMNEIDKALYEYLDSEEFKENAKNHFLELDKKKKILESQLERFHTKYSHRMDELVDKICKYYDSDKYYDLWVMRGFEPPEELYWFLFKYAKKYGRECSEKEIELCGNCFTGEMYYVCGYYFQKLDGQGSCIHIDKEIKGDS